jgi:high affinity Mn2+ porin
VVELNRPNWALRYGAFAEPKKANGGTLDAHVPQALGQVIELEERWAIHDHPGAVRVLGYANLARMGNYREAIDHPGPSGPDVALTRTYSTKYGFGLSAEQELLPGLGAFGRLGWNDGHTESWAFTEIDRTASLGLSLRGDRWHRPDDVVAIAALVNGISKDHRDYLAAGGLGFLLGDGRLHYGYEEIAEAYYLIKLADHVFVSADLQFIENPGYNRDRGPVTVGGLRVHVEF